jgi:hypothetical protein
MLSQMSEIDPMYDECPICTLFFPITQGINRTTCCSQPVRA